ncbi:diaminobutyrate--2-oxoglutarate transaminase [Bradyrhizobium sp. ORS 86]|uniref:diaminobutyrate--2-oxoglutarate transaminase n=1 Tax=Bradyrhizobium sp. ORS 86 TaxID=1685970 RepID=UPI003890FB22
MQPFKAPRSDIRSNSRSFSDLLSRARSSIVLMADGRKLIDFHSDAGTLNYGHNNHQIKVAITKYLESDAAVSAFNMNTSAKLEFMETFSSVILRQRGLQYRCQFAESVIEVAIELSRTVTGRQKIILFTHAYHGTSLRAVGASGKDRTTSGVSLSDVTFMPYDGYLGPDVDTAGYLRKVLTDESSGVDRPAAILVETVQGEGGIYVAAKEWLLSIQDIARDVGALFIIDDVQMGCGRTGDFFSFEFAGLSPDIVVLSNSLSGYGLPLSMLLIKDSIIESRSARCTSAFRGNNLALVSATAAVNLYWRTQTFSQGVHRMGTVLRSRLETIASGCGRNFVVRGRGMALGFDCQNGNVADATTRKAFEKGLMVEQCECADQVVKFLPALTIDLETLNQGLQIFEGALAETLNKIGFAATCPSGTLRR